MLSAKWRPFCLRLNVLTKTLSKIKTAMSNYIPVFYKDVNTPPCPYPNAGLAV